MKYKLKYSTWLSIWYLNTFLIRLYNISKIMTHSGKKRISCFYFSQLALSAINIYVTVFLFYRSWSWHDLLPNMNSNWVYSMSNTTDATNGAETASPYSEPKFTVWFVWGSYGSMLIFLCSILLTIICIFSFFWSLYYLSFNFPFLITHFGIRLLFTHFCYFQIYLPVCFQCLIIEALIIFFSNI